VRASLSIAVLAARVSGNRPVTARQILEAEALVGENMAFTMDQRDLAKKIARKNGIFRGLLHVINMMQPLAVIICFFMLSAFLVAFNCNSVAQAEAVIDVGRFSTTDEGNIPSAGWEPLIFPKIAKHTDYVFVKDGDTVVVKAISAAAASGLTHRVQIDLRKYPFIKWRWKVSNVIEKSDVARKDGDDYAARLYVTFAYEPDKVGFVRKLKYKAGRALFGQDIPIAAINYIWESKSPINTIVDNAYTDFVKMIVIESGSDKVGRWVDEERNLYEDYKKAFGSEPPMVSGVAIMTDTDNTGESVIAYYGDISFQANQ
jgi:Protein of unknown function (DUF3047)